MTDLSSLESILVPVDTSEVAERAIPWAKAVAGDSAEIVLLEVIPVATAVRSFGGQVIGSAETIQAGYQQMAEDQIERRGDEMVRGRRQGEHSRCRGGPGRSDSGSCQRTGRHV